MSSPSNPLARYPALAYGAVFVGVWGHATSEFFSVLSGLAGPETSVWRFLLGGFGLVVVALVGSTTRDLLTPLRRDGVKLVLMGFFGVSLPYLAFHWALDFATIVQVGTMVTTAPIFVGLANLAINRIPIGGAKLLSGVAAVIGAALLLTDGYLMKLAGEGESLIGVGLALFCAAAGAAFFVVARPVINRYGAVRTTALTMAIGGLGLWLIVGLAWKVWVDPFTLFDRPAGESAAIATLAFYNTTLTQILWLGGLAAVPDITRGSYLFFLKPVITAALALLVLGQPVTAVQIVAIVVICGAVLAEFLHSRRDPQVSSRKV